MKLLPVFISTSSVQLVTCKKDEGINILILIFFNASYLLFIYTIILLLLSICVSTGWT